MKRNKFYNRSLLFLLLLLAVGTRAVAQEEAAEKKSMTVTLRYFLYNNQVPYLNVMTKTKVGKKFQPVSDAALSLYLDTVAENRLIAKVKTDANGQAQALLPPALKAPWEATPAHQFFAVAAATAEFDEATADVSAAKARMTLDTVNEDGARSIRVTVQQWQNNAWAPANGVELKVGVGRMSGGLLPVGKEESYTTDSTGQALAEFARDSLPGDAAGNINLVADVEDNDLFGNLIVEQSAPWGVSLAASNDFNKRTLWSTRNKAPIWLLFMAGSVTFSVWGTLIYLVLQLLKIRKIGRAAT